MQVLKKQINDELKPVIKNQKDFINTVINVVKAVNEKAYQLRVYNDIAKDILVIETMLYILEQQAITEKKYNVFVTEFLPELLTNVLRSDTNKTWTNYFLGYH